MSKTKRILKWSLIVTLVLIVSIVSLGYWFINLLPEPKTAKEELRATLPSDLPYLTENIKEHRGKILAVVTSVDVMGNSGKSTGYELTELARAYYVFEANGFEVDVASTKGGLPPVVIDGDDMKEFDYAFLNDSIAQEKVSNSIAIGTVNPDDYAAIYFVGGKGAMFDFPDNEHIQTLLKDYYQSEKVIGAVCHGPAALVNVKLDNGRHLLEHKTVSAFTNEEELFLIKDAKEIFPFLLQDKLIEQGATFDEGHLYLEQLSIDRNLITGQNPWSVWALAEAMIVQLGYTPKPRKKSAEENSISVLITYESKGFDDAKGEIDKACKQDPRSIDRELIAVHSLVATMQFDLKKTVDLIQLLRHSNEFL
ncbi:type 1 glutamine amidotransferase domain-containing protein [Fulvivirga lutimaris]|uniref:type 1 glutamine amidotransferase domain-containing protein n=1 Tax=Fulvivirga lutimaris TaxID=1819566 RepID=UPI0012BD2D77|nr:type 1 glutamine amidotransferase domain-containing protein [Fulvivirga lutimaris]MTI38705.1 type 1 glutamine amidotransferase domain-containing protein [Fulvivirga lutimaris]